MHGKTFLCISNRAWDSLWGESQKIMSRIAKNNLVLFFEPGRSVNEPILSAMKRNFIYYFKFHYKRIHKNLIVIPSPFSLPIARQHLPRSVLRFTIPVVTKYNTLIKIRHIRLAIKKFSVKEPILWIYSPYHFGLVGKFKEQLSCYHNYDEFGHFVTNVRIKDLLQNYDNQLTKSVDVVLATSRPQCERRKKINPNSYFVPNGVNFELFNRALSPKLPIPADIKDIPHPIIGFTGVLGNHIDIELLNNISEMYPDCSMVLVGPDLLPDSTDLQQMKNRKNVYFLGLKPMEELPNYLKPFDVALIPYMLVGHVLSGYPQKLHEYLAAGRSIVATAMPELLPYSRYVRIAETHKEFVAHIRNALKDYSPKIIQARVEIAKENTWDHRVNEYHRILNYHFNAQGKVETE